jgi:hypothetical protein
MQSELGRFLRLLPLDNKKERPRCHAFSFYPG